MAHVQQQEYCQRIKRLLPGYFSEKFVLDVGALDVNGNNQDLFDDCLYLGLDIATGKNVDVVVPGHELALPDATFDVIISTECFEHDRFYDRTLSNIIRLLKPGGLFLFSCATTGRPEHGTLRTTAGDAPLLAQFGDWANYYKNLEETDIRAVLDIDSLFAKYQFEVNEENHDLYFWGVKAGSLSNRTDYSFQVRRRWLHEALRERDIVISNLQHTVSTRDQVIVQLHDQIMERDKRIGDRDLAIAERDKRIGDRDLAIAERDKRISDRDLAIFERDKRISDRDLAILERDGAVAERSGELRVAQTELARLNKRLEDVFNSTSWRVTAGLRFLRRLFK